MTRDWDKPRRRPQFHTGGLVTVPRGAVFTPGGIFYLDPDADRAADLGERQRTWLLHNLPGFAAHQWWFRRWRVRVLDTRSRRYLATRARPAGVVS